MIFLTKYNVNLSSREQSIGHLLRERRRVSRRIGILLNNLTVTYAAGVNLYSVIMLYAFKRFYFSTLFVIH